MNFFETIYLFFQSQAFQNIVSILKPVSFIAIFIFSATIIWALVKSPWIYWYVSADLRDFLRGGSQELETIVQKKWKKIKKRIKSSNKANWKLAIIEGEELIENALENMGYKGEGIKERLKGADQAVIPNLPDLISAYDIFINILSDPDYEVSQEKAIKVILSFEEFLKHFEIL